MNRTDRLAARLREAYAAHDPQPEPLVPWADAASEKRQAWRVIARAARGYLGGGQSA